MAHSLKDLPHGHPRLCRICLSMGKRLNSSVSCGDQRCEGDDVEIKKFYRLYRLPTNSSTVQMFFGTVSWNIKTMYVCVYIYTYVYNIQTCNQKSYNLLLVYVIYVCVYTTYWKRMQYEVYIYVQHRNNTYNMYT